MSKKIVRNRTSFSKNWTAAILGSLVAVTAQQAQAAGENSFRAFREQNPDLDRAALRAQFREMRGIERGANSPAANAASNIPALTRAERIEARIENRLERRIENFTGRNNSFQAFDGQIVNVNKGINLDLSSSAANVILGSNLFKDGGSITINVGGKDKTVSAGSQVSAAEYVAVKQLLSGGGQKVVLDNQGRATGGDVDLSALTQGNDTMRASDLVVPVNVTTIGDFNKGSDFRLLGDLTNSGTVLAMTSGRRQGSGGALRADDIINQQGALIKSSVENFLVDASGNFTNAGTISATGNITLQAAGSLSNTGSVSATGNVGINSNTVTNSGLIASTKGNVSFDGASTAALTINNAGGTVSAERGAINFRTEAYDGTFNTNINGGDFLSKEFNTHAGLGTTYADVGNLTGTINQTGSAAHVQAATDNLEIGNVCLTGDPTYRNTAGSITIIGNMDVNEALTVIAEGDINVDNNVHINSALGSKGYDITFVAGADITGVDGGANIPSIPPGVTGSVTINGNASKSGGSIVFGSNTSVNTHPGSTGDGGNLNLYAFEGATAGSGRVDIGQTKVTLGAFNNGINGSLTVVAGASSGDAIRVGEVLTNQSSFATGGGVFLSVAQPISSGGPISWGPDGKRTTVANLISSADVNNGNIVFNNGQILTLDGVIAVAGGDITLSNNANLGGDLIVLAAGGSLIADAPSQVSGATVYLFATNDIGSLSSPLNFQASDGLNVEAETGSAYLHSELGGVSLKNGDQIAGKNFVLTGIGDISVESNIIASSVSLNAQSNINFASKGQITATGNVDLTASGTILAAAGSLIAGDQLTLDIGGAGTTNLDTNVKGLTVTKADILNVHNAGAIALHASQIGNNFALDTTAAGNITVDGTVAALSVTLTNANGDISLGADINAASVSLDTSGGTGKIDHTAGRISALQLALNAGSGGIGKTSAVEFTNSGAPATSTLQVVTANGGDANVQFSGDGNVAMINASTVDGDFKFAAKDATLVSLSAGATLTATKSVLINAPQLTVDGSSITATNGGITIKGDTNLTVNGGGSGGTFNTNASSATEFIAVNGSLTTTGQLNFNGGDAKMTLQSNIAPNKFVNNGTLNGDTLNDLIITAADATLGTITNFAQTIIIQGNTIANSAGDVVLPSNLIFNGQDLAIIAKGNITGTLTQINLSSASGDGGNITILAGVDITPPTGGQIQTANPLTLNTVSTSGGKIDLGSTNLNTSSTSGKGGNVFLAAFAGTIASDSTITIGDINTKGSTTSGDVTIYGAGNISAGNIDTGFGKGVVTIQAARPGFVGPIVVTNGSVTGLDKIAPEAFSAGSLTLKGIQAKTANLTTTTGGITFGSGAIVGLQNLNATTTTGNYSSVASPSFQATNTVLQSDSGNFTFFISTITNLTSNVDTGTVQLNQAQVDLHVLGATGSAQNLILGGNNFLVIDNAINLGTGTLTMSSNNILQDAIQINGAVTAGTINLTSAIGGVSLNESITADTISLTAGGSNSITQATGKVINGGALTINEQTSTATGLSLAVDSLKIDKAGDFHFTQNGNIQLQELKASSVEGTVNNGNLTTGKDSTLAGLTLTVNDGSLDVSNLLNVTVQGKFTAKNDITTSGTGKITTPLLELTSTTGSLGTAVNSVSVDSPDIKLEAQNGNIFISDSSAGAVESSDPITTTGNVRIETVGSLETRAISANNIVFSAGSYVTVQDLVATNLIDITQTSGDLVKANFSALTSPALKLSATAGSVGTSALPFAVAAATTNISGFGKSVFITSANTTGVTLSGGKADGPVGSNFEFRTTGPLNVTGNIESTNGAVLLQNTAGLLQIGNGITILGDSQIDILNTGSVDDVDRIAIGTGATIKTDIAVKTPGAGNINIVQGKAIAGKVRKNIKNVVQNLQDGGKITFGGPKNAFIADSPTNTLNAIGANIYISTDQSRKDGGLTFGGGVTITADPPVAPGSQIVTYGVRNESKPSPTTMVLNLVQPVNANTASISNVALNNAVNAPAVVVNLARGGSPDSLLTSVLTTQKRRKLQGAY